jgi:hypothetical protein
MLPDAAARLLGDPEWRVRLEAAGRAPMEAVAALVDDPDRDVRERVRNRLTDFLRAKE